MMVYMKLRASVLYGWLVYFRELIKKYDETKMDLVKLKLSMWKRMQESLEKKSKQVNEINWGFKILSGT